MVELLCTVLRKLYTAFPLSDTARPPEAQKLQQVGLMDGWMDGWMGGSCCWWWCGQGLHAMSTDLILMLRLVCIAQAHGFGSPDESCAQEHHIPYIH